MENWRLLPFQISNAFENMAVDEALFRVLQERGGPPTLRFYGWERPALSVGYFQNINHEINLQRCVECGIEIVRRPTGGKAVLHDRELTYSVVSREESPFSPDDLIGNYQAICACLIQGFTELGIAVNMAGSDYINKDTNINRGAICFACPAPFELIARGRKICGSAQVRSRGCFLQHGSVLLDFDAETNDLLFSCAEDKQSGQEAHLEARITSVRVETGTAVTAHMLGKVMQRAFAEVWNIRLIQGRLTMEEETLKDDLVRKKYANSLWNGHGKTA